MSALIKVTELIVDERLIFHKLQNTILVIPFIKSFSSNIDKGETFINPIKFDTLKIDKEKLTDNEKFYGTKIKVYIIEYTDTSDKTKYIHFEKKEDAENFLIELKSCINDFYNNADAYIKYLN